jgi:hypothetical protein
MCNPQGGLPSGKQALTPVAAARYALLLMARGRQGGKEVKRRGGLAARAQATPSMPVDEAPLDPLEMDGMVSPDSPDTGTLWRTALDALRDVEDALAQGRRALGPGASYRAKLMQLGEAVVRSGWNEPPVEVKALLVETEQLRLAAGAAKDAALATAKQNADGASTQVFTDKIP